MHANLLPAGQHDLNQRPPTLEESPQSRSWRDAEKCLPAPVRSSESFESHASRNTEQLSAGQQRCNQRLMRQGARSADKHWTARHSKQTSFAHFRPRGTLTCFLGLLQRQFIGAFVPRQASILASIC